MEDQEKKDGLYIPWGIKLEREYFYGYGKKELIITIIFTLLGAGIGIFINLVTGNIIAAVLEVLILPTTTVFCIVKNDCNISVVDQLKFMVDHAKEQKKYYYVQQDEWK